MVNQVLFPGPDDSASPLLAARLAMQKRYLDQFLDLYEDYHLVQLPLQSEEVRGPEDIRRRAPLSTPRRVSSLLGRRRRS